MTHDVLVPDDLPKRSWRRLHVSTWLLLGVLAVALVLIVVPGEASHVKLGDQFEYGWPLVFRTDGEQWPFKTGPHSLGRWDPPWIHLQAWQWHDDATWNPIALVVDVAACAVILMLSAASLEWWRRRRRRWYRFGLRELLVLTTIIAVGLGYIISESLKEARILAMFKLEPPPSRTEDDEELGSYESYDSEDHLSRFAPSTKNLAPCWLAKLIGLKQLSTFERITSLELYPASFRDQLPELAGLRHLQNLVLDGGAVVRVRSEESGKYEPRPGVSADSTLEFIDNLNRLEAISLRGNFTDDALPRLYSLDRLKYLTVDDSRITDLGLREFLKHRPDVETHPTLKQASAKSIERLGGRAIEHRSGFPPQGFFQLVAIDDVESANFHFERLSDLPRLRELDLRRLKLTADDLDEIARCHDLVELTFQRNRYKHLRNGEYPPIDTAFLIGMTRLESLDLSGTNIGDQGLENLATLESLENLNLVSTGISSAGLAQLRELSSLRELRIYHNKIDDDAVRLLAQLTWLQILCLDVRQISNHGLADLRRNLPRCHIVVVED